MHLLGVCGHGGMVVNVERRLIDEHSGVDCNCLNKGRGGEQVSRNRTDAKFLYIVVQ